MLADLETQGDWRLLLLMIPVAVIAWWIAKQMDVARITHYGKERGWQFLEISYESRAEEERRYSVRYLDEEGNIHTAICKTSLGTGVFFTDDQKIRKPAEGTRQYVGVAIDCPRCGTRIEEVQRACPNCNTPRSVVT